MSVESPHEAGEDLAAHSPAAMPQRSGDDSWDDGIRALTRRSNARGLVHLAGHVTIMVALGVLWWHWRSSFTGIPLLLAYGFSLATMFSSMHESAHRTAFRSPALNDLVAWWSGVLAFTNSTHYRFFHGWHHRYTQIPGKDPELDELKPSGWWTYFATVSALHWWYCKIRDLSLMALGRMDRFPYIPAQAKGKVARSARLQILTYLVTGALATYLSAWSFVLLWIVPLLVGMPFLRSILLAGHYGCSLDGCSTSNTRTTLTVAPVRFLMWGLTYHAEHHHHPGIPFYALGKAHGVLADRMVHIERRGYLGVHRKIIAHLLRTPRSGSADDVRSLLES